MLLGHPVSCVQPLTFALAALCSGRAMVSAPAERDPRSVHRPPSLTRTCHRLSTEPTSSARSPVPHTSPLGPLTFLFLLFFSLACPSIPTPIPPPTPTPIASPRLWAPPGPNPPPSKPWPCSSASWSTSPPSRRMLKMSLIGLGGSSAAMRSERDVYWVAERGEGNGSGITGLGGREGRGLRAVTRRACLDGVEL